jgi:hypothetical protein
LTEEKLLKHFICVKNALNTPGIYIFDCTPVYNIQKNFLGKPLVKKIKQNYFRWENFLVDNNTKVLSYIDFYNKNNGKITREVHEQRIYSADTFISLLEKAGFNKIYHFEGFTMLPPEEDSVHYHFVATI